MHGGTDHAFVADCGSKMEHLDGELPWAEWEAAVKVAADKVAALKAEGADKGTIDPVVAELLHRKSKLGAALEAAMATLAPESPEYEELKAKVPPAPKPKPACDPQQHQQIGKSR